MKKLIVAGLFLTGCSFTLHGGGNPDQFWAAYQECDRETLTWALIPDMGMTRQVQREKCMLERGWLKTPDHVLHWTWVGD